ncbi:hypothetical protein [Phocaeicola fibrisolvens]|uniref:hypothetical protein n=1 Tax=Phocaeicola fibrisolvens TaxID=2981793 RepID=UPI0021D3B0EC|nr:hypothetical protein [Phocaeicola fibrisolvens]MCU6779452.1 hypothetical protein [Phocaeicola fibrisolvens]
MTEENSRFHASGGSFLKTTDFQPIYKKKAAASLTDEEMQRPFLFPYRSGPENGTASQ